MRALKATQYIGMIVVVCLFVVSLLGVAVAVLVPEYAELLLIAGPVAIASLVLCLARLFKKPRAKKKRNLIVLDGSNVMHWKDGDPKIETVHQVVLHLQAQGHAPGVIFDANAGYLVSGKYRHDASFGASLGLPERNVMVVPKGEPADPFILKAARDMGARIVTNDRYRDWVSDFPEIQNSGHLIKGGFRSGKLWLDLDQRPSGPS